MKDQIKIEGLGDVTVSPYAPLRGITVKARLLKTIAPILHHVGPLLDSLGSIEIADLDVDRAAPVLGALLAHIDPDTLPELIQELLDTTSVVQPEGKQKKQLVKVDLCDPGAIDRVFAGKEQAMFRVIGFALKVHFAGLVPRPKVVAEPDPEPATAE